MGCTIDERPELPDGRVSDLKIVVTPGEVQNTYLLHTNRTDVIGFWDLGNGNTASGVNSVTAEYPFPGDYTISLKAYGDNGRTNDVSVKLSVTTENLFLLNDPMYTYIARRDRRRGQDLDARCRASGPYRPVQSQQRERPLVGRQPNGKAGCELYDDEATFILNSERGQAFGYVNNGKSSTLNNMIPAMELYNDGAWSATAYNLASTNDYIVAWYAAFEHGLEPFADGRALLHLFPLDQCRSRRLPLLFLRLEYAVRGPGHLGDPYEDFHVVNDRRQTVAAPAVAAHQGNGVEQRSD